MKKLLITIAGILFLYNYESKAQTISTIAGNGISGYTGDGGASTSAQLNAPYGTRFDASGNMYIADALNHRIRKINTNGIITTIAGTGVTGYSGDGGPATAAQLYRPTDIAIDATGNMYISDEFNHCIRKIDTLGIISTFAGTGGVAGYSGDGGAATAAQIYNPNTISIDVNGNIYISDYMSEVIRKVNTSGIITTIVGNGSQGYSGDGGQATSASLYEPCKVVFDNSGNLYFADEYNLAVRKVDTSGIITTVAGNGTAGYSGDGGAATLASINYCEYIQIDGAGNLYIADKLNNVIRKVDNSGIITTVVGNGNQGYSGNGGLATSASLYWPEAITFDITGNMYISDWGNNAIRKVTVSSSPCTSLNVVTISGDTNICAGDSIALTASGASAYSWSANAGGSSSAVVAVNPSAYTIYSVTGIDSNGCITNPTSFTVNVTNGCVWPGDADENLVVDMFDLLTIGLEYGKTGAARSSVTNTWQGYKCTNWTDTLLINGKNAKYADCNGDSTVDLNDTLAVVLNYNQSHAARMGQVNHVQTTNPDIYLTFNKNTYVAGDVVVAYVNMGSNSNVQNNFYGTSFTINYDASNVVSGSESFVFNNSWIGNTNQSLHLSKIFSSQGVIDAAIVRTNHTDATGYGQIATLSFTLKNNISNTSVNFTVNNGVKVNHSSNQLTLSTGTDSVAVVTAGINSLSLNNNISIYPNPSSNMVTIEVLNATENCTYKAYNTLGQEVKSGNLTQTTNQINVQDLTNGVYNIVVSQKDKTSTSKIIVQK